MKFNNILAKNMENEPVSPYMKFDYADPEKRIQQVRENRMNKVRQRSINKSRVFANLIDNDSVLLEKIKK